MTNSGFLYRRCDVCSGVWQSLFQSEGTAASSTNGYLTEIVTKLSNITTTNRNTTEITGQIPTVQSSLPNELMTFLLGGSIAFIIFVVAMKFIKKWRIKRILERTINEQQDHWQNHVRLEFIRLLKAFFYGCKAKYRRTFWPISRGYFRME